MTDLRPIRVCYADPPYPGQAARYHHEGTPEYHHDALRWDDPAEHVRLMARLHDEFPDGWALSTSEAALRSLLPGAPSAARVGVWVTSSTGAFAIWRVAYAWEAVIYYTPFALRVHACGRPSQLDWIAAGKGHHSDVEGQFLGAKPLRFCFWLFRLLGLGGHPQDALVDLFPGSGAVTRAWQEYRSQPVRSRNGDEQCVLFGGER